MVVSVKADLETTTAQDDWVNLTTNFSSVEKLEQAFEEALRASEIYHHMLTETNKALTAAQTAIEQLTAEVAQKRASLKVIYATTTPL